MWKSCEGHPIWVSFLIVDNAAVVLSFSIKRMLMLQLVWTLQLYPLFFTLQTFHLHKEGSDEVFDRDGTFLEYMLCETEKLVGFPVLVLLIVQ
jgi:hypothetical protein